MASNTRPPGQDKTRTIWTIDQENALSELMRQRDAAMAANRPPVLELVNGYAAEDTVQCDVLADWLITHATAVRQVLVPFDLESARR